MTVERAVGEAPGRVVMVACAIACGAMVANIYYAQPLIGRIAPELGLSDSVAGLIVMLTQLGYGLGLLLMVPLADRLENRRLILLSLIGAAAALSGVALSTGAATFLVGCVLTGFCSAGAQVVVPYAAALVPEARRGATIGNIMAGLLAGIMLARPLASMVTDVAGWRAVFWISAGVMLALLLWLRSALPRRVPSTDDGYAAILRSMGRMLASIPLLRRRALYQGAVFAIFNIFWTTTPLILTERMGYGQRGIALFGLAGAAGALAAPIAGRLGDRGYVRIGTGVALATISAMCALWGWSVALPSIALLVTVAVTLDAAAQVNQVLGQRVIYGLAPAARGRINAVYMSFVFVLGACGSALATVSYDLGGWLASASIAAVIGIAALLFFTTEPRPMAGQ